MHPSVIYGLKLNKVFLIYILRIPCGRIKYFNYYYNYFFLTGQVTSQNPYAEVFVGKPFVQTVNIKNKTEVEVALKNILSSSVSWKYCLRNSKTMWVIVNCMHVALSIRVNLESHNWLTHNFRSYMFVQSLGACVLYLC